MQILLNRQCLSQRDILAGTILTPPIFSWKHTRPMPKGWGQWKFPTLGPPGPPEPLFRGQTPQNREIAYFARNFFLPFGRSCRTIKDIHTIPKKFDPAFFGSSFDPKTPKNGQKRAKFKKGKSFLPPDRILIWLRFLSQKYLNFIILWGKLGKLTFRVGLGLSK